MRRLVEIVAITLPMMVAPAHAGEEEHPRLEFSLSGRIVLSADSWG